MSVFTSSPRGRRPKGRWGPLLIFPLLFLSCEKDFIDSPHCVPNSGGNIVGGWDEGKDSTVTQHPDSTVNGGFDVTVDEWGDTVVTTVPIKQQF